MIRAIKTVLPVKIAELLDEDSGCLVVYVHGRGILVLTRSDEIAEKIIRGAKTWEHKKGDSHAFTTAQVVTNAVIVILDKIFPNLSWESLD